MVKFVNAFDLIILAACGYLSYILLTDWDSYDCYINWWLIGIYLVLP
jgi:hypothetical protein